MLGAGDPGQGLPPAKTPTSTLWLPARPPQGPRLEGLRLHSPGAPGVLFVPNEYGPCSPSGAACLLGVRTPAVLRTPRGDPGGVLLSSPSPPTASPCHVLTQPRGPSLGARSCCPSWPTSPLCRCRGAPLHCLCADLLWPCGSPGWWAEPVMVGGPGTLPAHRPLGSLPHRASPQLLVADGCT